jgi:hypothetical protein
MSVVKDKFLGIFSGEGRCGGFSEEKRVCVGEMSERE